MARPCPKQSPDGPGGTTSQAGRRAVIYMLSLPRGQGEREDLLRLSEEIVSSGAEVYWISFDSQAAIRGIQLPAAVRWLRLCQPTLAKGGVREALALAAILAPVLAYLAPAEVIPWRPAARRSARVAELASGTPVRPDRTRSSLRFSRAVRAALQATLLTASPRRFMRIRAQAAIVEQAAKSILDCGLYASRYRVRGGPEACVEHYVRVGQYLGYEPHTLFWPTWYAEKYLAQADITACAHYFGVGGSGDFDPNPYFRSPWYREKATLSPDSRENPLLHYLHAPGGASIDPNPLFDTRWYLDTYPDARNNDRTPLENFVLAGDARTPSPFFLKYPSVLEDRQGRRMTYADLFGRAFEMLSPSEGTYEIGARPDRPPRRFAICSAITGDYDRPRPVRHPDTEIDYFMLVDEAAGEPPPGWKRIVVARPAERGPLSHSRYLKMNLMELVPGASHYDAIAYVDGNLEITGTLARLFHDFADSSAQLGLIPHPARYCAYQEAVAVMLSLKDAPTNVMRAVDFLAQEGFPPNAGLYEMNFYMFKPSPEAARFLAEWWRLFRDYGNRDQLLVPYLLWKNPVDVHCLVPEGVSVRSIRSFAFLPHGYD